MAGGRPHLHISEKVLTHTHSHARGNSVSNHFPNKNMLETVYLITFRAKSCWKQRFFDEFSDRHIMNIPKGIEPKGRRKKLNLDALDFSFQQRGMI